MNQESTLVKVNRLLKEAGLQNEIRGLNDLKKFIYNKENMALEVYDEVEELYDNLMLGQGMW